MPYTRDEERYVSWRFRALGIHLWMLMPEQLVPILLALYITTIFALKEIFFIVFVCIYRYNNISGLSGTCTCVLILVQ